MKTPLNERLGFANRFLSTGKKITWARAIVLDTKMVYYMIEGGSVHRVTLLDDDYCRLTVLIKNGTITNEMIVKEGFEQVRLYYYHCMIEGLVSSMDAQIDDDIDFEAWENKETTKILHEFIESVKCY